MYTAQITANMATLLPLFRHIVSRSHCAPHHRAWLCSPHPCHHHHHGKGRSSSTSSWGNKVPTGRGASALLTRQPTPPKRCSRFVHFADADEEHVPIIAHDDTSACSRSLSVQISNAFYQQYQLQQQTLSSLLSITLPSTTLPSPAADSTLLDLHKSLPPLPAVPELDEDEFFKPYLDRC